MTELTNNRRFYLIRHGETDDNRKKLMTGRRNDTFLTQEGIAMAVNLQDVLANLDPKPTHIVSSTLERAEQTLLLAAQKLKDVVELPPHPDFDERDYEIRGVVKTHGFEPYEDHQERVVRGINQLLESPDCIPLIVSHGGTVRRVLDAIGDTMGTNFQESKVYKDVPNASVIEVVTPSYPGAEDWQINKITLEGGHITRASIFTFADRLSFKREEHQERDYHA